MKPIAVLLAAFCCAATAQETELKPPARAFPPVGDKLTAEDKEFLTAELQRVQAEFDMLPKKKENANAEIFLKAVRYALDYSEFYKPEDGGRARGLLAVARHRITALKNGEQPWLSEKGLVVRGYYSSIDGSAQPFGMEIPNDAPDKNAPAWLWLQGRGETRTDLHFLDERQGKPGQFQPPGTIIVHPWGRYCVGTKNAGEQEVLAVREILVKEGRIDPKRVAICGFSMGGAGAWLLGAHYTDKWAVVHPGAGFVEVRKFQNVKDEVFAAMPKWEVTLWGQNDVPDYARNLLNVPVVAYSGENDKQRQAAEIMTEALAKEGLTLKHFIGPKTEHKYEPETRRQVEEEVQKNLLAERPAYPLKLTFQTKTLDYSEMYWIEATGLEEHWKDSRIDAELDAPIAAAKKATITTKNVSSLKLRPLENETFGSEFAISIDGQDLKATNGGKAILVTKVGEKWKVGAAEDTTVLRKRPGLQGPIDDAFTAPFLFVLPDGLCATREVDAWVKEEIAYQTDRWRYLMRGDVRAKKASEVTQEDVRNYNLVLWGDAKGNALIASLLPRLPVKWTADTISVGKQSVPAQGHVLSLIYPTPAGRYIVLNSGLTFRENHKSNAVQNPQLPDWAIIDLSTPPDGLAPGKIVAADFFDENWKVK
jgi:dienelactone hydrolase